MSCYQGNISNTILLSYTHFVSHDELDLKEPIKVPVDRLSFESL